MSTVSLVKRVVVVYRKYQEDIIAGDGVCDHRRRRLVTITSSSTSTSQTVKLCQAPKNMYPLRILALIYVLLSISCTALAANQTTNGGNKTSTTPVAQVVLKVKPLNASTTTTTTTTTTTSTTLKPKLSSLASNGTQKVISDAKLKVKSKIAPKPVEVKRKKMTSKKNKKNNGTRTKGYGEQQEASLLRPLILRSLGLGGYAGGGPSGMMAAAAELQEPQQQETQQAQQQEEEEEEEVTQTIYTPIKDSGESGDTESSSEPSVLQQASSTSDTTGKTPAMLEAHGSPKEAGHLKPEASLQLTSTEISSLLNDRDAPEFYRERELQGDGVLVGEERPPPLTGASSTAASNLGIHHMGGYSGGLAHHAGYESDAFEANHRLAQAASGGGYPGGDYSGFSHRFGSFGGGGGGDDYSGRLMQSPNEYSEYHHGRFGGYPQSDYSAHSGLLRAGSGDFGGPHDSYGPTEAYGHSTGAYLGGGHRLEQHSSELYGGPGGGLHSDLGGYYGGGNSQRLLSAAAHHPGYGAGSHLDDYTSRYGSSMGGFEQRGFAASQHNSVSSGGKLMPLSPVVPVAEEIGGSASSAQQFKAPTSGGLEQQQQQVNEPVDEQDLQASLTGSDEAATSSSSSSSSNDSSNEGGGGAGDELVLNYPPPGSSSSSESKPRIEFSRFGSAGYLPPTVSPQLGEQLRNSKKILKKMSALMAPASQQLHQLHHPPGGGKSDYDPAENPAHAGKYIID